MDFRELMDAMILAEEIFGVDLPEDFTSSRKIVDWFELRLLGWGPNARAAALLNELATYHANPRLAEGLHGEWRREQIAAIVNELFGP